MIKCALPALLAVLSAYVPVEAQQPGPWQQTQSITLAQLSLYRPEVLTTTDSSTLIDALPMLVLLDSHRLPISTPLGRLGIAWLDLSPVILPAKVDSQKAHASPEYKAVAPREVTPSRFAPEYISGEAGFLYGRSTGKSGGDLMETYILGTTGNDKFQISVGAAYEESSGRGPRWAR